MSYIVIQPRRGTQEQAADSNPVLAVGERGFETDTRRWKTGDGSTNWNSLPYDSEGGGGATDLSVSRSGTAVTVASSTGADAVLAAADGSNAGVMTAAMQTKLGGIATSATANATDASLRDRSTHTGAQPSSSISDFTEAVQDAVAALLAQGTNVTLTYDDAGNVLTIAASSGGGGGLDAEGVRDAIGVALLGAGNITVTANDALDTITITTTATVNDTDANLKARANHTGTQAASTISDFSTAADARIAAATGVSVQGYSANTTTLGNTTTGTGSIVRAASPAFSGTPTGITKSHVGLANVDNTSDADKPISTATQAALDALKVVAANNQTGTTYTLVLADALKVVECNNAGAITLTVPPNSSEAFPVGTVVEVWQQGAGQVTVAAGAGVTIRSPGGLLALSAQYSSATLRKRATDEWVMAGDLA